MDQHSGHAQAVGDQAGVLAAGAAETVEHVPGDVVAALHGDLLDRVRHVLDRDADEAVGDLLGRASVADLARQGGERCCHGCGVEGLVLVRPENFWKEIRDELSHHHVGVGDRQRPAAAVAGRPRIGAGGIRADAEPRAVEVEDRASSCRHRVDQHHRCAHAHPRHLGLEGALVLAVKMADVGRRAAHVEADQPGETGLPAGLRHADHAARRPRQDGVLALEQIGRGEPARRHHEHQPDRIVGVAARRRFLWGDGTRRDAELTGDPGDVARQDRRQIGVDHGGVAAADQLDQRRDLVAHRHLGETELARQRGDAALVLRIAVGVDEQDRHRPDAVRLRLLQRRAHRGEIGLPLERAVGAHAFVDLDDALEQHFRLDDLPGENFWARLVADLQRIAKTPRGDEDGALALALQQRVGGDRGAHLHRADATGRDGLAGFEAEEIADALHGGVAVGLGVFRQQLVGGQPAVRMAADHVGEGAAAIDPEIPPAVRRHETTSPSLPHFGRRPAIRRGAPIRNAPRGYSRCLENWRGARPVGRTPLNRVSRPVSRVLYNATRRVAPDGHSSGTPVARRLEQPTRTAGSGHRSRECPAPSLFGLAPGGVCRAATVAGRAVRSYRTVSPLPASAEADTGGLFSVALSLGSPPPDVIRHRMSMEPGLSSPATFRPLPGRPSGRLTRLEWGGGRPASRAVAFARDDLAKKQSNWRNSG